MAVDANELPRGAIDVVMGWDGMTVVGDTNVHVQVDGTTFAGFYERVGSKVYLSSADFGEQSAEIGNRSPQSVAEHLLRAIAAQAIRDGMLFVRDDGSVAASVNGVIV